MLLVRWSSGGRMMERWSSNGGAGGLEVPWVISIMVQSSLYAFKHLVQFNVFITIVWNCPKDFLETESFASLVMELCLAYLFKVFQRNGITCSDNSNWEDMVSVSLTTAKTLIGCLGPEIPTYRRYQEQVNVRKVLMNLLLEAVVMVFSASDDGRCQSFPASEEPALVEKSSISDFTAGNNDTAVDTEQCHHHHQMDLPAPSLDDQSSSDLQSVDVAEGFTEQCNDDHLDERSHKSTDNENLDTSESVKVAEACTEPCNDRHEEEFQAVLSRENDEVPDA
ncbi:hypothetical protein Acr_05g0004400 [Actinidia rufa]|uniref:Uncharacterized protein n=1 Tax=Actinidia rufa TaxID=165716 RepID=A0A7J0EK04_9ERIC|nr:hypothetical protein Acr_05g0004400 [Actinidia rufa]